MPENRLMTINPNGVIPHIRRMSYLIYRPFWDIAYVAYSTCEILGYPQVIHSLWKNLWNLYFPGPNRTGVRTEGSESHARDYKTVEIFTGFFTCDYKLRKFSCAIMEKQEKFLSRI